MFLCVHAGTSLALMSGKQRKSNNIVIHKWDSIQYISNTHTSSKNLDVVTRWQIPVATGPQHMHSEVRSENHNFWPFHPLGFSKFVRIKYWVNTKFSPICLYYMTKLEHGQRGSVFEHPCISLGAESIASALLPPIILHSP